MLLTVVVSLGAALWMGGGFVIQQHIAAEAPWNDVLSLRLLGDLIRRPAWLGGIAVMFVGQLLGAIALGRGSLALVEPLLAANLLFALPLTALWGRKRLRRREWCGALTVIIGLAGFLIAAEPGRAPAVAVPIPSWLIAGGTILALVAGMVWWARRSGRTAQGILLGAGAGLTFGLQDALTNRVDHSIEQGVMRTLTSWQPYTLLAIAVLGLILDQSAFRAAPLTASLPGLTVAEPLAGIGLGAGLFADRLRLSAPAVAAELVCLGVVVLGVRVLSRSPLFTSEPASEGETREMNDVAAVT